MAFDPNQPAASPRAAAEAYLGRKLTDTEYDHLIRATYAEADPGNPTEAAMVAASILNRTRNSGGSVVDTLYAPNQFESVTGNPANGHKPSGNFTAGPDPKTVGLIEGSLVNILPSVSPKQTDFTAASPAAYGPGDDIGVLNTALKNGYSKVGGTVFNTAPPGSAPGAQTAGTDYRPPQSGWSTSGGQPSHLNALASAANPMTDQPPQQTVVPSVNPTSPTEVGTTAPSAVPNMLAATIRPASIDPNLLAALRAQPA